MAWEKTLIFYKENENNQVTSTNPFRSTALSPSLRTNTAVRFWSPFMAYSLHCLTHASSESEAVHSAETCVTGQCAECRQCSSRKNNPLKSHSYQYKNQTSSMNEFN